jgi:hypothetical protein
MTQILAFLKLHKAWLISAGGGLVLFLNPSVQSYVQAHPHADTAVASVWAIAMAWAKSPRQS